MPKRVLLAGLFHETHTFLDGTTGLADFAVRRRDELFDAAGDGSPLSGVLQVAASCSWEVRPVIDLRATPSAIVDDAVFTLFWDEFATAYARERTAGLDGIFLVLHGAMVCPSVRDVEGELIDRIRSLPGARDFPVCGVLDLHGNLSRRTIEQTQGLIAYRMNPHADARQAAVDAALLMDRILTSGRKPLSVFESCPMILPPTATGTADEPMRSLEALARQAERESLELVAVNVFAGYSFADTFDTGLSFSAATFGDPEPARRCLRRLREHALANRQEGHVIDLPLSECLPRVLECIAGRQTPIALVEPADNIGGGAPGDAPTILRMLIENQIEGAAVILNDPAAVQSLADLSVGGSRKLCVGGKASRFTDPQLELDVTLVSRSDGRFELEDRESHLASMCGVHIDMGPCAVVRSAGVTVLLTSKKTPPFDLGQLRSQGIEPEKLSVIGVKAAVAHRRAYDRVTKASFTVATPGPCSSDLRSFPYKHVRRPIDPLDEISTTSDR
ncbi:MAG TPA: M81 family metallopeptidase [Planctomycetaceae bacterium]|jgi:microcystin degradation protein MlrC|nr:M81 family metallopeptidase [Planctomycetaceae bacterium]